ncbi:MAG: serine hydrolase domain-containing protein [Bacteroidota bacterium]
MNDFKLTVFYLIISFFLITTSETIGQSKKIRRIQKIINKATEEKLVGATVYIKSPELGEWTLVSGYSDLENSKPLRKDDVFGLASIGKTYTATAIFKLIEEGYLALDDKISNYLPSEIVESVPRATDVTVRHLLGHTSGFANYNTDPVLNQLYLSGQLKLDTVSHIEILRKYFYEKPLLCEPGEEYHYSVRYHG